MKRTIVAFLAVLPILCIASADSFAISKEEAQKKVDEVKAKQCEGVKTYLNAQKASCPDEAAAAANITCSAKAFTDVQALNVKCSERIKSGLAATSASASSTASSSSASSSSGSGDFKALAKDQCQATDESGAVIAQHTSTDYSECSKAVQDEVKKQKCAAGTKSVKYFFQRGEYKPFAYWAYCN